MGPAPAPGASPQEDSEFLRKRKRSWARLIAKVWLEDDPALCRSCGKPMKIIAAIAPEQEDVIERVLRHLHLWDPPWKRQRKVRGVLGNAPLGALVSALAGIQDLPTPLAPRFPPWPAKALDATTAVKDNYDDSTRMPISGAAPRACGQRSRSDGHRRVGVRS